MVINTAYPNLNAEMQSKRHSVRSLVMLTDLKYMTMYLKLKDGKITVEEALKLKAALESKQPLEKLFARGTEDDQTCEKRRNAS